MLLGSTHKDTQPLDLQDPRRLFGPLENSLNFTTLFLDQAELEAFGRDLDASATYGGGKDNMSLLSRLQGLRAAVTEQRASLEKGYREVVELEELLACGEADTGFCRMCDMRRTHLSLLLWSLAASLDVAAAATGGDEHGRTVDKMGGLSEVLSLLSGVAHVDTRFGDLSTYLNKAIPQPIEPWSRPLPSAAPWMLPYYKLGPVQPLSSFPQRPWLDVPSKQAPQHDETLARDLREMKDALLVLGETVGGDCGLATSIPGRVGAGRLLRVPDRLRAPTRGT
eukprot:TRINITY_DN45008_c0_g1_i1.p1 TRINITY_DN45008_c0_g1~~TRINITY_DN45008_c0_g1_i1.p1  ORF type:complete len:281 (+),score=59.22 TRINITY_DN45008_c0_g1_i1:2-844(+)